MRYSSHTLFGFLIFILGCDLPGKPRPEDKPVPANEITDFKELFQTNCSGCHGSEGNLGPAPPLNDPIFLAIMPKKEIELILTKGRPGSLMPAFATSSGGSLTTEQVAILVDGLKDHWKSNQANGQFPAYELPGDKGNPSEGAKVFARACAGCHGTDGLGGKSGKIHDREYLSLMSDQVLRRLIITGRPDLGMPDFAAKQGRSDDFKPLSNSEIADLSALLAAWRQDSKIK